MSHLRRQYNSYSNILEHNRGQYYNVPELQRYCSQSNRIDDHRNVYAPAPVLHQSPVKTENYPNQWTTTYRVGEDRVSFNKNGPSEQDMINLIEHSRNMDLWTSSRPNGQTLKPSRKTSDQTSCTILEDEERKRLRNKGSRYGCCCCCSVFILYLVLAFCIILLVLHLYYPEELHIFGVHSKPEKINAIVTRNKEDIDAIMNLLESLCRMWINIDRLLVQCEQVLQKRFFKPN